MKVASVCLLGGTGFVGRAIAEELAPRGIRMRIVTRLRQNAAPLTVLPTAEVVVADAHDPATLRRCFEDMDAVINLVGILHETRRQSFRACHEELPRKVAEACGASGVRHLLHMSALGAAPGAPSQYLRSKAAGEAALRAAAGIVPWTIMRPSVIFGERDRFLNLFATLVRWNPVLPLAAAQARFQPVWVEDVARCFTLALGNPAAFGAAYNLCGPNAYTLEELVRFVARTLGRRRAILALPAALGKLQALAFEHLPGKLMTRDNLASMSMDNVCADPFPPLFGFNPSPLEAVVPEYLVGSAARARYPRYRHFAGR
ncbi:MAG TPA: complex I NDUFA9 subunit family protein [Usitatibacter sp.]|nr:complex I NDUFA9 subunit family protein [Usitatibacter sp.]